MDRFIIAFSGWRHHIRGRGAELGRGCEAGSWGWSDSVRLLCCYLLDILDQSNCLDQLQNPDRAEFDFALCGSYDIYGKCLETADPISLFPM